MLAGQQEVSKLSGIGQQKVSKRYTRGQQQVLKRSAEGQQKINRNTAGQQRVKQEFSRFTRGQQYTRGQQEVKSRTRHEGWVEVCVWSSLRVGGGGRKD